ncbi:MAG: hypothetical protein HRT97_01425 [Moritella sp.]|uniref:hypothetical protein n=1 Tax=Moritella sp. TaxID=78556 RepID=UPI0025CBE26A|nr:hypothetical protein [Moritella sp.]NQZ90982.1 hypothetical protein [Moritella sp.]
MSDKCEVDHGFDGVIMGALNASLYFIFTHYKGATLGKTSARKYILIFYFTEPDIWAKCGNRMIDAGFQFYLSYNT